MLPNAQAHTPPDRGMVTVRLEAGHRGGEGAGDSAGSQPVTHRKAAGESDAAGDDTVVVGYSGDGGHG